MDSKIIWSREALSDLETLHAYIANDSEAIAGAFAKKILDAIDRLARFPMMGPRVRERAPEPYRHLVIPPYRVVYRVARDKSAVFLVRIIRGRRDLLAALRGN